MLGTGLYSKQMRGARGGEIVHKKTGQTFKMKREAGVYTFNICFKKKGRKNIPGGPRDTTIVFTLSDGEVVTRVIRGTNKI